MMHRESYYLEFRAINIYRLSNKQTNRLNYSRALLLKLRIQDTTRNPLTIAESLQWAQTEAIQGTVKCIDAKVKVELSVGEQETREWTVKLFGVQRTALELKLEALDESGEEVPDDRQMKSMGLCKLNPLIYAEVFNDSGKTKFQQNIQISSSLSLDYEVYIHSSPQGLEEVLREEEKGSHLKIVDTAFKKPQGVPKIRCVQFNENRQKSLRVEQFDKHQQRQISSLKKSGAKFVPIQQPRSPRRERERRKRGVGSQKGARGGSQKRGSALDRSGKRHGGGGLEGGCVGECRGAQREGEVWGSCLYVLILLLGLVVTGYMMFPSKKV